MNTQSDIITLEHVAEFLSTYYESSVNELVYLSRGKRSVAFAYTYNNNEFVIRFNEEDRGFRKDLYAYEHFSSHAIPIPKIFAIGKYDSLYFCISERAHGETVRDQYKRNDYISFAIQFKCIETIASIKIPDEYVSYDEWEVGKATRFSSFTEYALGIYPGKEILDWDVLQKLPFFNQEFISYLVEKIRVLSLYSENIRELLHGDFGNDNLFIVDGKITGIIDWERSMFGDHLLDVGRMILFCPNREESVRAALTFYEHKGYENYKERILLGVYFAMLKNYGFAARDDNESSCAVYPERIKEMESLMEEGGKIPRQ